MKKNIINPRLVMDEIDKFVYEYEKKQKAKKLFSLEIAECKKDAIGLLIEFELWKLEHDIGHIVAPGENIWKIIYKHAVEYGKKPIPPERLQDIAISPWDKVYFTKDYVYISFLQWWNTIIPFEKDFCKESKNEKKNIPDTKFSPPNIYPKEKKVWSEKNSPINEALWFQSIFDKDSPLLWDRIAYKHEVFIRKTYGKQVEKLIDMYCKWSLIDESFLYGVIARESRFNPHARSHTGVMWLGQITSDTVETIININTAKVKSTPSSSQLYITSELKDKNGKIEKSKTLQPLSQIKLTISYLLYLESLFQNIWDDSFKKELIITSYNLWPGKTKDILSKYSGIKDWKWLKKALRTEAGKWQISSGKLKEITQYVPSVLENIHIAGL